MNKTLKVPLIFAALLFISASFIYLGSRNDAVSVAKNIKSGVVMSDNVNAAFQNIGGKLVDRPIIESQLVQKGDILMVLEDIDTTIGIKKLKAIIQSQEALINHEELSIDIDNKEADLLEITSWRKIEEIQAALEAATSTQALAKIEYDRNFKLQQSGGISKSIFDNVNNTFINSKMAVIQIRSQLHSAITGASKEQIMNLERTKSAEGMALQTIANIREKINNRENQLNHLRAQLAQFKAELQQLELHYDRLTLRAPETGKVLKILYEEGEMIPMNAPAVILETDRKYVDIYVNESLVNQYQAGTKVSAFAHAIDSEINGIIRFATPAPSFADLRSTREQGQADLTSYQVRVYITEMPTTLLKGMTVEVKHE